MTSPFLASFLRAAGRRVVAIETTHAAGLAVAAVAAAVCVVVALDAVFGFAAPVLYVLDAIIVLTLIGALVGIVRMAMRSRFNSKRLAVLAEGRLGIGDSSLINALEFSGGVGGGMSVALSQLAVRQGESAVASLNPVTAADRSPALRGFLTGLGAAAVVLAFWLLAPRVFQAVVPRLMHPGADLPAFTLVRFDIRMEPKRVIYGHAASIVATLSGPVVPEKADIVFADGEKRARSPLGRHGDAEYVFRVEHPETSRTFYIDTPQGRSEWQQFEVQPVPVIEAGAVRLEYPEYTGWAAAEFALVPGTIRAIEGTRVRVTMKANLPVARGEAMLMAEGATAGSNGEKPIELSPRAAEPTVVDGSFPLNASTLCRLDLVGRDGTRCEQTLDLHLVAVPDAPPQVFIIDPSPVVVAPEGWKVQVKVAARDDVGLEKMTLRRGVNGIDPTPIDLPIGKPGATFAAGETTLDLDELGAKAGDTVRYFASAFDRKPGSDRFTDTPTQTIQVISQEDYNEMVRNEYGMKQMEEELDRIEERMAQLQKQRAEIAKEAEALTKKAEQNAGKMPREERTKARQLARELEGNAAKTRELSDALEDRAAAPSAYEFEDKYKGMLHDASDALDKKADASDALTDALNEAARSEPMTPEQAQDLKDKAKSLEDEDQNGADSGTPSAKSKEEMKKMRQAGEMAEQASRLSEMVQQQRELADQLSECDHAGALSDEDKVRAARLGQQQADLKKEMDAATSQLKKLAEESADSLPKMSACASKLCNAISGMNVGGDQEAASQQAKAGKGSEAHEAAESAAKKLESLLSQCNGMGEPNDELDGCLGLSKPQMQKAMKQLAGRRPGSKPGSKSGKKPGKGQSGQGGEGSGESGEYGESQALNPGQQGPGKDPARSKFTLMGPHKESEQRITRASMGHRQDAPGKGTTEPGTDAERFEQLNPDSATSGRGRGGALLGVPARYRQEAEYYFRRLSEDVDPKGDRR